MYQCLLKVEQDRRWSWVVPTVSDHNVHHREAGCLKVESESKKKCQAIKIGSYLQKHQEENGGEQKNSSLASDLQRSLQEEDGPTNDLSTSVSMDKQCRPFSLAEIKSATHDFDDALVIGKGGFGNVYKGNFDFGGQGTDVAIKRLKLDSGQGATEFRAEIEMLSKFRHSHIVSLFGYHEASDKKEMILVYEYMSKGSLEDHLHKKSNSSLLTWVQKLHICIGAARGLDYLHTGTGVESRVIHRDIKSSNILLDENLVAKISDFGLSRIGPANLVGTAEVYTNQIVGTFGYMDAEYFATHRLTRKSDVYAFGVVLLEVLCGRPALDFALDWQQQSLSVWAKQCIQEGKIDRIIDPCLRGQTIGKCLKEFGRIAYECVLARSEDRPTMTKVVARLELVLARTLHSDHRHIGISTFLEKPWSLFLIKAPKGHISSSTKKLGQSGGVATTGRQVVPPTKVLNLKKFTFSELQSATRNFAPDMYIGEGGFGKVYKGCLDDATFAVKRLRRHNDDSKQGVSHWQAEIDILGTFSHPNVVKLLVYCQKGDKEFLLVYEFMQKGSLDQYLFREGGELFPWETRIKIVLGTAQALAFLHNTENNVIFRDVKTSNILLDGEFNAKLSDFGLAKLGPVNGESHVSTLVMGTKGYTAPEYLMTGHLYAKSDVYGFGLLMLEMITGLIALDTKRPSSQHILVDWARPSLISIKKLQKIIDPRLKQVYPSKGAMKVAKLILSCLEMDRIHRPSMEEVVASLEEINSIK